MLARDTDWRQGDVLMPESSAHMGLVESADEARRAIVITHDCDLPNENEPHIEVIVADIVPKEDSRLTYAKNPRRLHIAYEAVDATSLIFELRHTDRRSVSKADFSKYAAKDHSLVLPVDAKRVLKQWLAARYGRPAFPNEFEKRLRSKDKNFLSRIEKILEPNAKYLVGLFFNLGEQRGSEAATGVPYALSVSVVYGANEGGPDARSAAERVAKELRELFEKTYGKPDVATEIALEACEAVADTHLTLADLRRVDQWRLEHISLRDGEQGDFLSVGEIPA